MQKIKNEKFSNSVWHYIRLYLECIQDSVKKYGACRFKMHDFRVFMEISFQLLNHIQEKVHASLRHCKRRQLALFLIPEPSWHLSGGM